MKIIIRKHDENDWPRLCDIHDAARVDELRDSVNPDAFKSLEDTFEDEGLFDDQFLVAEYNDVVSGFIAFDPTEITWLYVDPSMYRKGIGAALLNAALPNCNKLVACEVLHKNKQALSFYQKHGFKILEKKEGILEGNETYKAIGYIMELENLKSQDLSE